MEDGGRRGSASVTGDQPLARGERRRKDDVTGWKTTLIIACVISLLTPLTFAREAQASTPKTRLRVARIHLAHARAGLRRARLELKQALALRVALTGATPAPQPSETATAQPQPTPTSTPAEIATTVGSAASSPGATATPGPTATASSVPTDDDVAALRCAVARARHKVRHWRVRVRRLRWLVRAMDGKGSWMPYIGYVARQNALNAGSMYRMMILESGGRTRAVGGGGSFLGLFQYSSGTWHGSWNPWRSQSIFDGAAQIRATAKALRRGYGPSWWPNTYPRAF